MQPSQSATIRPHLEGAIQDIDTFLDGLQQTEDTERELVEWHGRLEAGETIPKPNWKKNGEPISDAEWEALRFAVRGGWQESSRQAAVWLRNAGEAIQADGIGVELSKLPTEPPDATNLQDHRDTRRKAAEQVKRVLTACLGEENGTAKKTGEGTGGKKSTAPGEARAKLIAALTLHHKYKDGSCLNQEPIGLRVLTRKAHVSPGSGTPFFNDEFAGPGKKGGHTKYKAVCRDMILLLASLKELNGETSPYHLYDPNSLDAKDTERPRGQRRKPKGSELRQD